MNWTLRNQLEFDSVDGVNMTARSQDNFLPGRGMEMQCGNLFDTVLYYTLSHKKDMRSQSILKVRGGCTVFKCLVSLCANLPHLGQ